MKRIHSALISVYHKEGLLPLLHQLKALNIKIFSTGGTYDYIAEHGFEATPVEEITGFPSIFGGRVKTLHPAVMGGILFRRDHPSDLKETETYSVPQIDLVVVDLYPFAETVAAGGSEEEITEKIDIGGISLIRAAAKNHHDVVIIPDRSSYPVLAEILHQQGETSAAMRRSLAIKAFDVSSAYDAAIYQHLSKGSEHPSLKISSNTVAPLRYGENPHQKGFFYGNLEEMLSQLHGKELSYNNLLDIDSAMKLMEEFNDTTVAILKHNNACGLASREHLHEAWDAALEADPMSAFGGVIITNRCIDFATAEKMNQIFFEVVIAPEFTPEAFEQLSSKKNRIILKQCSQRSYTGPVRNVLNGYLVQDPDKACATREQMNAATHRAPEDREFEDLVFANKIVKHTKSNAIVLVHGKQLIGSGTGQTSRIDAMQQAIAKARLFNLPLKGAVVASDAFFPFPDNVEVAHNAGITAVVQPGGSVKDQASVDFCNAHDIAMVFTGIRHFKH